MRKIFLTLVLTLTATFCAHAWNKQADAGIVILATQNLKPAALQMVQEYLGDKYEDDVRYLYTLESRGTAKHTKDIHYLLLDNKFNPVTTKGENAFTGIEQALDVVRNRTKHTHSEVKLALRTLITLMCDIHEPWHVRIEGIDHSMYNFKISCAAGDYGSRKVYSDRAWSKVWTFPDWHVGFPPALWAEDMAYHYKGKEAALAAGTLHDWAAQLGSNAASLYKWAVPGYSMTRRQLNELEELNFELMARAGFRLAALLNSLF